jgi:glycerol-3-phosphate dehydrogenase (NAD(P)+)
MSAQAKKIAVLGAGSWGTALANHMAENGFSVALWMRDSELVGLIKSTGMNAVYLPGVQLSKNIQPTFVLSSALSGADMVISAVPSHGIRAIFKEAGRLAGDAVVVNAAKGIEEETCLTCSAVLKESGVKKVVVLSGPSFAREVASKLPCALVAASDDAATAEAVQDAVSGATLRVYTNPDVMGVELGGAIKNVMAIAAGISDGLGLGSNARAALITRGLAEMTRLGRAMGARAETFFGLSGLGDLVLTCTGDLSRNRKVGMSMGGGQTLEEATAGMKMVAEGIRTARAVKKLARKHDVEMPITEEINRVLYEGRSPRKAVMELMTRRLKHE